MSHTCPKIIVLIQLFIGSLHSDRTCSSFIFIIICIMFFTSLSLLNSLSSNWKLTLNWSHPPSVMIWNAWTVAQLDSAMVSMLHWIVLWLSSSGSYHIIESSYGFEHYLTRVRLSFNKAPYHFLYWQVFDTRSFRIVSHQLLLLWSELRLFDHHL